MSGKRVEDPSAAKGSFPDRSPEQPQPDSEQDNTLEHLAESRERSERDEADLEPGNEEGSASIHKRQRHIDQVLLNESIEMASVRLATENDESGLSQTEGSHFFNLVESDVHVEYTKEPAQKTETERIMVNKDSVASDYQTYCLEEPLSIPQTTMVPIKASDVSPRAKPAINFSRDHLDSPMRAYQTIGSARSPTSSHVNVHSVSVAVETALTPRKLKQGLEDHTVRPVGKPMFGKALGSDAVPISSQKKGRNVNLSSMFLGQQSLTVDSRLPQPESLITPVHVSDQTKESKMILSEHSQELSQGDVSKSSLSMVLTYKRPKPVAKSPIGPQKPSEGTQIVLKYPYPECTQNAVQAVTKKFGRDKRSVGLKSQPSSGQKKDPPPNKRNPNLTELILFKMAQRLHPKQNRPHMKQPGVHNERCSEVPIYTEQYLAQKKGNLVRAPQENPSSSSQQRLVSVGAEELCQTSGLWDQYGLSTSGHIKLNNEESMLSFHEFNRLASLAPPALIEPGQQNFFSKDREALSTMQGKKRSAKDSKQHSSAATMSPLTEKHQEAISSHNRTTADESMLTSLATPAKPNARKPLAAHSSKGKNGSKAASLLLNQTSLGMRSTLSSILDKRAKLAGPRKPVLREKRKVAKASKTDPSAQAEQRYDSCQFNAMSPSPEPAALRQQASIAANSQYLQRLTLTQLEQRRGGQSALAMTSGRALGATPEPQPHSSQSPTSQPGQPFLGLQSRQLNIYQGSAPSRLDDRARSNLGCESSVKGEAELPLVIPSVDVGGNKSVFRRTSTAQVAQNNGGLMQSQIPCDPSQASILLPLPSSQESSELQAGVPPTIEVQSLRKVGDSFVSCELNTADDLQLSQSLLDVDNQAPRKVSDDLVQATMDHSSIRVVEQHDETLFVKSNSLDSPMIEQIDIQSPEKPQKQRVPKKKPKSHMMAVKSRKNSEADNRRSKSIVDALKKGNSIAETRKMPVGRSAANLLQRQGGQADTNDKSSEDKIKLQVVVAGAEQLPKNKRCRQVAVDLSSSDHSGIQEAIRMFSHMRKSKSICLPRGFLRSQLDPEIELSQLGKSEVARDPNAENLTDERPTAGNCFINETTENKNKLESFKKSPMEDHQSRSLLASHEERRARSRLSIQKLQSPVVAPRKILVSQQMRIEGQVSPSAYSPAVVMRHTQNGRNSGSGTIKIINEAAQRDNNFRLLKKQQSSVFDQRKSPVSGRIPPRQQLSLQRAGQEQSNKIAQLQLQQEKTENYNNARQIEQRSKLTSTELDQYVQPSHIALARNFTKFGSSENTHAEESIVNYENEPKQNTHYTSDERQIENSLDEALAGTRDSQASSMFNNIFSKVTSIFASANMTAQTGRPSTETAYSQQTKGASDLSIVDEVPSVPLAKPLVRYGRICECPKDPTHQMFCVRARNWYEMTCRASQSIRMDTRARYNKLKAIYKDLANMQADEESLAQIERDLSRTFPRHHYFMQAYGGRGHEKLRRVLIAFSNYERQVNYVQGMNFIVAQLLLHCTETFAFWLFVALIEDCEMRDIYEEKLSGLFKHSMMIDVVIQASLPDLHARLTANNIRANVFASEWIFGLFASVIPCEHMALFFDAFFRARWIFFYQLILSLLKQHEHQIISEEDFYHFMRSLKVQQYRKAGIDHMMEHMSALSPSDNQLESSLLSFVTSSNKTSFQGLQAGAADPDESLPEEEASLTSDGLTVRAANSSYFSLFTRFISDKVNVLGGAADAVDVASPEFWPSVIVRCSQEWSEVMGWQATITRLLANFDGDSKAFAEELPTDHLELRAFLASQ